jgi:hypothetical protein
MRVMVMVMKIIILALTIAKDLSLGTRRTAGENRPHAQSRDQSHPREKIAPGGRLGWQIPQSVFI